LIVAEPTGENTDLLSALEYVNRTQKQRAVVFVLSDFFIPGLMPDDGSFQTPTEKALSICAAKHDVIAMPLTDNLERNFPAVGLISLQDAETGEWREVDTGNAQVRQALAEHFQRTHGQIEAALRRCRIDQLRIESGSNFLVNLRKFFRQREKRHS
jgi:uncharacterized protein (DUF58 family)